MICRTFLTMACLLLFGGQLNAQQPAMLPDDGTLAWAVARADTEPRNADAAYNAALRSAQQDQLGQAIYYLEHAHLLQPFARDIQDARVRVQRELRRRRLEESTRASVLEGEPQALATWRLFAGVPPVTLAAALLLFVWLTIALLVARRRLTTGALRDGVTIGAGVSTLGVLLVASLWIGQVVTSATLTPAVVVVASPKFRDAPDELARLRSTPELSEGVVVLVRDRREDWSQVELVGGDRVWVPSDTVRPVAR